MEDALVACAFFLKDLIIFLQWIDSSGVSGRNLKSKLKFLRGVLLYLIY